MFPICSSSLSYPAESKTTAGAVSLRGLVAVSMVLLVCALALLVGREWLPGNQLARLPSADRISPAVPSTAELGTKEPARAVTVSNGPGRALAGGSSRTETKMSVGTVGAEALLDFQRLTPEADQVATRPPGDLDWLLESPRWNATGAVLTPEQRKVLSEEIRTRQAEYSNLNVRLTENAASLAVELAARGELKARSALGRPEGFHRTILAGRGDQAVELPLTPLHLPELAVEILAADAYCQSIADYVVTYLANPK
jgi:hypothetical protein